MILVIDKKPHLAAVYSNMLHYMGVVSRAVGQARAFSEISPRYRAVIVVDPTSLADAEDYVKRLRSYASKTPIFSIMKNSDESLFWLFDMNFPDAIYSSTLLYEISNYCAKMGLSTPGSYTLSGIDASVDRGSVSALGTPVPLTRTEAMILRYLICAYPASVTPDDVLKFAYKETRRPERSSVRAHICFINKKFTDAIGRNLIVHKRGEGYSLITTSDICQKVTL